VTHIYGKLICDPGPQNQSQVNSQQYIHFMGQNYRFLFYAENH